MNLQRVILSLLKIILNLLRLLLRLPCLSLCLFAYPLVTLEHSGTIHVTKTSKTWPKSGSAILHAAPSHKKKTFHTLQFLNYWNNQSITMIYDNVYKQSTKPHMYSLYKEKTNKKKPDTCQFQWKKHQFDLCTDCIRCRIICLQK